MKKNWKEYDDFIVCFNLQNKITPYKADMNVIKRRVKKISKERLCSTELALQQLKRELYDELNVVTELKRTKN